MSEERTVYQLRCTGSQDAWNRKHSFYSQTVYLDRQAAEADAAAFHAKCTRSEGVSSLFDLDPDAVVTIVELTLVTPSPPRRTLADVVKSPPDGWDCEYSREDATKFRSEGAAVWLRHDSGTTEVFFDESPCAAVRATAHAVADLLDLLAEVSDA